jgi:hypothetical protein
VFYPDNFFRLVYYLKVKAFSGLTSNYKTFPTLYVLDKHSLLKSKAVELKVYLVLNSSAFFSVPTIIRLAPKDLSETNTIAYAAARLSDEDKKSFAELTPVVESAFPAIKCDVDHITCNEKNISF